MALLGPLRAAEDDGTPIDIGGARLRTLLARLALDVGRAVPPDMLIDGLWGGEPPADAANALQSLVSRLRRVLRQPGVQLESGPGGYRLAIPAEAVDVHRFEQLAAEGRNELAAGRDPRAAEILREALELWRGVALADVLDAPFAAEFAGRLDELRAEVMEDRFEAELRLGRHAEVLSDLAAAVQQQPLRERLVGLRIQALCAAGRQADALHTYEATRVVLAEELGVDPSAELQDVHLRALRGEFASAPAVADRLPQRLTSFIGRTDELKLLAELLADARLVTLVGPGGAGKTRLATEAASRHPAQARSRVWFVPLAGVRDAADVLGSLLAALEVRETRVGETEVRRRPLGSVEHAAEVLSSGESLLVLDNCEHVIDTAARLADDLLRRVPGLRVLATSREPLAITGEALCPLGPLPVPAETALPSEVGALDSARLFLDRAVAVRPGFHLDESTVEAVTQICRRLDGMPLALELAAARLRSMTAGQIAERLDDRFRLLTSGSRTALPRQRTLRAVVEWSWDLLTDTELRLARRLAVFASSFDEAAAEAVCADEHLPAGEVVYVLGSLVEKSIVDTLGTRYRMLETLRVYADDRLAAAGERERFRSAMVAYYLDLAERTEPILRSREQLDAIAVYEAENDNLSAALRAAIDAEDGISAGRLLFAMFWYLTVLGQSERAGSFLNDVLKLDEQLPPDVSASLRMSQAMLRAIGGPQHLTGVTELVDECVRTGAADRSRWLTVALPVVAHVSGLPELARREVRRAVTGPDAWGRAAGYWAESFLRTDAGDLAGAAAARERAHAGFAEIGDRWGLAMTYGFRAADRSQSGDHEGAIADYTEGVRLALELRSHDDVVQQWWRLAEERSRAGDQPGSRRELDGAWRYAEASGTRQLQAILLLGYEVVAMRERDFARAREIGREIRSAQQEWPFPDGGFEDEWLAALDASLLVAEEKPDEAEPLVATVLRVVAHRADMPRLAEVIELLARIRYQQHETEEAARLLWLTEVVRGRLDLGSPEVRELIHKLGNDLGQSRLEELAAEVRRVPRAESLEQLLSTLDGHSGQ
ncbi:DNA-binding SARP family transcriptional activator/predicted ATPase [Amycolatopsis sulphurea]|uniref:DNA-binding SARP family transcriptional activator/predicted ATPase n=1 Tax=Amycolatopsis sulphurea TaxID=76022 RepID=A0A2A9FDM4_9PSEU|nr:DNA-binding SARP family transcriptional activator/predicted ATPase [Amycolatopsis sulphurea]